MVSSGSFIRPNACMHAAAHRKCKRDYYLQENLAEDNCQNEIYAYDQIIVAPNPLIGSLPQVIFDNHKIQPALGIFAGFDPVGHVEYCTEAKEDNTEDQSFPTTKQGIISP